MALRQHKTTSFEMYFPRGVKQLVIANSAVFLVYFLSTGTALHHHMTTLFSLWVEAAVRHLYVWQVFTYMFLHENITHLLFNMMALIFFGAQLEQDWGRKRLLTYYFLCGIAAGVCVLVVNLAVGSLAYTIGSSGAIFGILVAFGVLYPDQTVLLFMVFPMKAKHMVMIFVAIELILTFGPNTGVSTVAHLGGAAFGYLYVKRGLPRIALPDFGGAYRRWQLRRAKKRFQVYLREKGGGPRVN